MIASSLSRSVRGGSAQTVACIVGKRLILQGTEGDFIWDCVWEGGTDQYKMWWLVDCGSGVRPGMIMR